jgi:hypothetical protein
MLFFAQIIVLSVLPLPVSGSFSGSETAKKRDGYR